MIANNVEKLKDKLLCGIKPEALDPSVQALASLVDKLILAATRKDAKALEGMSMADLSKALMNVQKALDGVARLRAFAAGGPDSRPDVQPFILKIVSPDTEPPADGQS